MDYKTIKNDNYNIHIIKNKKYHNIIFTIYFAQNIDKVKFAYQNLLVNILTTACNKYNTRSKIIKKTQDLYSVSPYAVTFRSGNLLITKFAISILDSKYLDKDIIKDNILLLKEIILNPLLENGKFSDKYFNLSLNDEITKTERMKEHIMSYVNYQAIKLSSDKEENYLISKYFDIDELKKLTNEGLYQEYQEMLKNSKIDIFLAGNITNADNLIYYDDFDRKIKIEKEIRNREQSKISVILKSYHITDFERKYVSVIYNDILGGSASSFLYMMIREKNSFAYSMYSYYNKPDNIITINGGFNKENYNKVIEIINDIITKISMGKFSSKLIDAAKKNFFNDLINYDESNMSLVNFCYGMEIFNSPNVKERKEMMKKVTKDDVIAYAKKIKIAAIYYLEGDL